MGTNKTCTKCYQSKALDCFYKCNRGKDGLCARCKECYTNYQKSYDEEHHKVKTFYSWMKQGMTFRTITYFEKVYFIYMNTEECQLCYHSFEDRGKYRKNMDHFHYPIRNNIRCICCIACNMKLAKSDRLRREVHLDLYRYFNRN